MPGALSDADRNFLEASQAGLGKTPGANAGIIMLQRRLQQRNLDLESLALTHEEANDGNVTPKFLREVREYGAAHPLFDDAFRREYKRVVTQPTPNTLTGAAPATPATPPSITSEDEYNSLPSGAPFMWNGQLGRKP